jgi:hypothetical protein
MQMWDYALKIVYIEAKGAKSKDYVLARIWSEPIDPKKGKNTHWDEIKQWGTKGGN